MSSAKRIVRSLAYRLAPRMAAAAARARSRRLERRQWQSRIEEVLACPDSNKLQRHPGAGRITGDLQTLFNGVKVVADGYYGAGMTELLRRNRGSHEPQEELVFGEVLRRLAQGARMIECGAYWGFYSLWFAREIPHSRVWLIEPEAPHLDVGRRNFETNGLTAEFTQALVGRNSSVSQVCIDDFLTRHTIDRLQVLHADIQGAEVEMLHGAAAALAAQRIDFVFISTHGEDLHQECVEILNGFDYDVAVSVRPCESYSVDGLIVGHRRGIVTAPLPLPSLKPQRFEATAR